MPPEPAPPDPRVGVVLQGRYKILERIASGAMGVVYRGERVSLGRTVAVKFLHPWIAAQQAFRTRFETEARAMSRLSHPNCVSVIDFGLEGASPYVVMDFITGVTLRELLTRGRVAPPRAVAIVRQVLAGVAHAHSQQIIHRDLKPENLILNDTVGFGDHVRILDFGLAKLRDGPAMTSGLALGTPSYMSPEQTGAPGEIDGRTDIYAVGVLLFEMLAGRKPFVSEKIAEILLMHRDTPPPSLRLLVPEVGVSAELESAINRALAKNPDARFPSATEFAHALEHVPEASAGFRDAAEAGGAGDRRVPGGGIQIGPSLASPVNETIAEPATPSFASPSSRAQRPVPASAGEPRGPVGPRMWMGLGALLVLALVLVAVGLQGAPPLSSGNQSGNHPSPTSVGVSGVTKAASEHRPPSALIAPSTPATAGGAPSASAAPPDGGASRLGAAPPVTLADRLRTADLLVNAGEWEQAKVVLEKAHRENPADTESIYRLANVALEHQRWAEGAEAARVAGARERKYRSDERLVKNLIRSLGSDRGYEKGESVLQGFGSPAVPLLKEAAAHDASAVVRQRARELVQSEGLASRPRSTIVSRSKSPAAASSRSFFSR